MTSNAAGGALDGPLRSFLFAPANHARRVEKAWTLAADAVILDLEDAVADTEKVAARSMAAAALQAPRSGKAYVRVNAMDTPHCHGDLLAVLRPGLDGIILPKVESAPGLLTIDWLLAQLEREHGLAPRSIDLIPILETARAVTQVDAILGAGSRVRRAAFGAGDYTLDLGVNWSRAEDECRHARDVIVTASRSHGLEPPLDSAWVRLDDADGLRDSARRAAAIGFQGKMCIHPLQVDPVNEAFSPGDDDVAFAQRIVTAFREAESRGSAAFQLDGKFVDYPILFRARRVLAIAGAIAQRQPGAH